MPLKTTFAYIGTDRDGVVRELVRDFNDNDTAIAVSDLIADGLLVQRLPIDLAKQAYAAEARR